MDSGGGSDNQGGREGRTPPGEDQMRIGRARVAGGFDPGDRQPAFGSQDASGAFIGAGAAGSQLGSSSSALAQGSGAPDEVDSGSRFRPWSEPAQAGPGPMRCHFLRSVEPDGRLSDAQRTAVPTHRCAAYGDPLPLSLRQQELVCLQRVHVSCPRYVRGTLLANENQAQPDSSEDGSGGIPLLTIIGVGLVILALGILFTGIMGWGPLGGGGSRSSLPIAAGAPSASMIVAVTPRPTATPAVPDSSPASPTPASVASPTHVATPTHAATPTPTPAATPKATSSWPPGATASRMSLVVPCTDQANCYVYTVRGAGPTPGGNGSGVADTLAAIARYFGVDLAKIRQLNPWLGGSDVIHPGDKLKIPPPTR